VNAVAPEQVRQREVARVVGGVLHRPSLLPTPAAALRLALGEQADLLLHGQRAVSTKLAGGEFVYPELKPALVQALS
jgi:NAD dependent epimerase/dehydratase family enzyme